jgi:hypothetical protein
MKNTWKKWLPLVAIVCGTTAFAGTNDNSSYDSSMTDSSGSQKSGSKVYREITPAAQPTVDNGVGFSLFADYLLWEARTTNVAFAYSGVSNNNVTSITTSGKGYEPGFKYQSGFKVGASAELWHDNWDLEAQYIWLHSNDKETSVTSALATTTLTPTWVTDPSNELLTQASGQWNLRYNVAQLNLGRNFLISENLSLRPYYGIKGGWNHQANGVNYLFRDTSIFSTLASLNIQQRQTWWGVGFQTGVNTGWWFDENWGIYANIDTSLMWGRFRVINKVQNTNTRVYSQNFVDKQYGIQSVFDVEMGLRWQMSFDDNTYAFLIQAGWEQQIWLNHTRFTSASGATGANLAAAGQGDLSIQGFTIRARFYF